MELFTAKSRRSIEHPQEKPIDIDSEIDWKIIDQLHNAVLNFSRNSMQAKKIMFTLLGIFVAAMIQAPTIYCVEKWFPVVITQVPSRVFYLDVCTMIEIDVCHINVGYSDKTSRATTLAGL